jgi:Reverse transcriptase (RNA-dependent DNA polymerase)
MEGCISKELQEMKEKGVYEKICKSELPNGCTCIRNKWVLLGVDFQESFAPVINDVTFRILLLVMLTWNLKGKIVDIETAFLHGDLKETIYMQTLTGLKAEENQCLVLKKKNYGLVQ